MKHKISMAILAMVVALTLAAPAFGATPAKVLRGATPTLNVFAAASLNHVFLAMVPVFKKANPKYKNTRLVFNFQGTDTLVAQIQQGAPADVFAGASTKYGNQLFGGGFLFQPQNFCRNKLVVITPRSNPAHLRTLQGLKKRGVMIAIGDAAVPIGTYTRTVLANLSKSSAYGADYKDKVLANVVANCINVTTVVSLVVIGEVDAGFVYKSDAKYVSTRVQQITVSDTFQTNPLPTYPIAVTKSSTKAALAQRFVRFVLSKKGQALMLKYGFLAKPKS